jgi:hypothetical protein
MTRNLLTLAIVAGGLAFLPTPVRADPPFGIGIGIGPRGVGVHVEIGHPGPRHGHRHFMPPCLPPRPVIVRPAPVVHVHARVPVYGQVWVPARYEQVFVGYGFFGAPVYRTVCVCPGHYETVVTGYRCEGCGMCF